MLEQHFSRYEFKYVLSLAQREFIEEQVRHFMRHDEFVIRQPRNQYLVRSLYFDSPSNEAFFEKIDGIKERRKYRLRTYARSPTAGAPLFLEEKGRHNQRTYKHRIKIDLDDYERLVSGLSPVYLIDKFPEIDMVHRFVTSWLNRQLRPKVLVDYSRSPYVSDYDAYFRITIDSDLSTAPSEELFATPSKKMLRCLAGHSIVEVKFNRRVPAWFHRIIQSSELHRVSISKFVVGMAECGIAKDLS